MSISISVIILILVLHFIGDFVLQSDTMATNKSSSNKWLSIHISIYMIPLVLLGWQFALVNGLIHFGVDYCTSRITSYLWKKKRVHDFFVVIGFDQFLHVCTLFLTYTWIVQ